MIAWSWECTPVVALGCVTLPFGDESGKSPVAIDLAKLALAEGDQSIEQRYRCLLGGLGEVVEGE